MNQWLYLFILKIFYLFIFREKGGEREREGEKHQCVVASCTPPTGDLALKPRRVLRPGTLHPHPHPRIGSPCSVHWATPSRAESRTLKYSNIIAKLRWTDWSIHRSFEVEDELTKNKPKNLSDTIEKNATEMKAGSLWFRRVREDSVVQHGCCILCPFLPSWSQF